MPTPPITTSPGSLFLKYLMSGIAHTCSFRLVSGVDIMSLTPLGTTAATLASLLAECIPNAGIFTEWGVKRADGSLFSQAALETPYPGVHGTDGTMPGYLSAEWTIHGKANPTSADGAAGRTSFSLFPLSAIAFYVGQKSFEVSSVPPLADALAFLDADTTIFADKYGQKADTLSTVTVQFNAHIQRKYGC